MASKQVIGRSFGSDTVAVKTEEGDWKVTVSMVEKRLLYGETEWEVKELASVCTDSYFENAYKVATEATLLKFSDRIKETGTDSLFEELVEVETKEE